MTPKLQTPPRLVITGSSGLVGRALTTFLSSDYEIIPWKRDAENQSASSSQGKIFESADAVIHLAGEGIASGRWTVAKKKRLISSRVDFTQQIVSEILKRPSRPRVFIAASAVGFYGDRGSEICDEATIAGEGFLADLCQAWEAETLPLKKAGLRVVNLRIGIVLSSDGGALEKMLKPFKLGLGGPLGTGTQYMSWIALKDLVRLIRFALESDRIYGPLNAVAPSPVTNREFSETLARVLGRRLGPSVPAFVLKLMMGEMADALLLASTRVGPKAAVNAGFRFEYPNLERALRSILV